MFVFALDHRELFDGRRTQFASWGTPRAVIDRVERRVTDSWHEGPGGWVYEWLREAVSAMADKGWLLAAIFDPFEPGHAHILPSSLGNTILKNRL